MINRHAFRHIISLAGAASLLLAGALLGVAAPEASPLNDAEPVQETLPADAAGRPAIKQYVYRVPERSVIELTVQLRPGPRQDFPYFIVQILSGRTVLFDYRLENHRGDYLYFPVLEPGNDQVLVRGPAVGTPFTLGMRRIKAELADQEKAAALAAIDKATASLLGTSPAQAREEPAFAAAIESLVMAALGSDPAGKNLKVIEKDYLPWLKEQFHEAPGVQWNGEPVGGITRTGMPMYETAIATLALAEIAPHSDVARSLATQGANFLLAAQVSDRRPLAWRPVARTNPSFGGWRYAPYANDADLSVSGWCAIALNACAVADIRPDPMREALQDAVNFVAKTQAKDGFGYQLGGAGGVATIRDAIGALVFQLYGEHSRACDAALAQLDRHLFAGTQADDPDENYPLYYAYYATRLHYLRGGEAWAAWRMSVVKQLLRLQRPDGSWGGEAKEAAIGPPRYATALSILILRMCLDDAPAYMTQEVRGF